MGMVVPHLMKYQYEFTRDSYLSLLLGDSLTKNSTRYEWTEKNKLVWKDYPSDTSPNVFNVSLLSNDSLILQSEDSSILLFTKVKK